jgi:hypothetical protein
MSLTEQFVDVDPGFKLHFNARGCHRLGQF